MSSYFSEMDLTVIHFHVDFEINEFRIFSNVLFRDSKSNILLKYSAINMSSERVAVCCSKTLYRFIIY